MNLSAVSCGPRNISQCAASGLTVHSLRCAVPNSILWRVPTRRTRYFLFLCLAALIFRPVFSVAQTPEATPLAKQVANLEEKLTRDEKTLQDWPNLARHREANSVLASPAKDESRVIFMGDSITDMWAQPQFGGFFPGKPYVDRGISGQTTPQMLIRFRPDVLALQPRVVVILAGTNDIAGNTGPMTLEAIEGNLASMSDLAHSNADPRQKSSRSTNGSKPTLQSTARSISIIFRPWSTTTAS